MTSNKFLSIMLCFVCFLNCSSDDTQTLDVPVENQQPEEMYFPPIDTAALWETKPMSELGWDELQLQELLSFLEDKNSKSFILLHKGKLVVEHYMNGHTEASPWYWASAGKTLTTAVVGIAEQEGLLAIENPVSDYLGNAWTSTPLAKEHLITCKNLLSMTSGLDDTLGDCVLPENLQYMADAGERWAYHNVYVKLQDVVANASNQSWTTYFNSNLKNTIGMTGAWVPVNDFNVYWSNTRSMARFGLLIAAKGKWKTTQIIPESFLADATNSSQSINEAYGYLWWLNGKSSYLLPQSQFEFQGALIPNAPDDMYCALGRDDQKIYIVPSKDLVLIRMGETADNTNFALSNFDNELWSKINAVIN